MLRPGLDTSPVEQLVGGCAPFKKNRQQKEHPGLKSLKKLSLRKSAEKVLASICSGNSRAAVALGPFFRRAAMAHNHQFTMFGS
jgi:hypothetical protein